MDRKFVIAGCAWGEHYTDMLINYCLPSMIPSIGAAAVERRVIIHLHTDNPYKINSSPAAERLRNMGIELSFDMVDDIEGDKYLLLGKYQGLGVDFARKQHADFHSLMPDHVYSQEFFTGLMNAIGRGHKAITRLCLSTKLDEMVLGLAPYRRYNAQDGEAAGLCPGQAELAGYCLAIPSVQLVKMALKNLHPRSEAWRIKGEEYPDFHVAFKELPATVWIHSPHQSIVYLDRDCISPAKTAFPLDSELDNIIPALIPVHATHPDDCMAWVEIARDMPVNPLGRTNLEGFEKKYRKYASVRPYPVTVDICS